MCGVLQFMGSQRVGHDRATNLIWCVCVCVYMHETFLSVTGNLLTVVTFDEYSWESMEPWAFSLKFHAYRAVLIDKF